MFSLNEVVEHCIMIWLAIYTFLLDDSPDHTNKQTAFHLFLTPEWKYGCVILLQKFPAYPIKDIST